MRTAKITRKTKETDIEVEINLDGQGLYDVTTGIGFLDHMIASLATHSLIDINIKANGDLNHHIVEDVAICLGEAILKALNKQNDIYRFGYSIVPMDDSLAISAIDLSRRPYVKIDLKLKGKKIENMPCENIFHFLETLGMALRATLHVSVQQGGNDHHKIEASFKALALSIRQAISIDSRRKGVPSSKGMI